jgi:hypothetical protein
MTEMFKLMNGQIWENSTGCRFLELRGFSIREVQASPYLALCAICHSQLPLHHYLRLRPNTKGKRYHAWNCPCLYSPLCTQWHEPSYAKVAGAIHKAMFISVKELHPTILPFHANPSSVIVSEQEEIISLCALASISYRFHAAMQLPHPTTDSLDPAF